MTSKVERFVHRNKYRFIKDYTYKDYCGDLEFKVGDTVTFDYPGLSGTARFYTDVVGEWRLLIIKAKEAFKLFEEAN